MTLTVNGTIREVNDVGTVGALLDQLGITRQAVAVMVNGLVIPREHFSKSPVKDQDTLEIVRFVGGG